MRRMTALAALPLSLMLTVACSKDDGGGNTPSGTGGSGGRGGTGGSPRTGGASGTGGIASTGGAGGTTATGGSGGSTPDGGGSDADGSVGDGGSDAPASGSIYILASAGASYGAPTPISTLKLDPATGNLTKVGEATGLTNAFYGGISSDKKFAYFTTEQEPANIATFSINANGTLTKVVETKAPANHGEFIGLHPSGKWLAIPHYSGGEVTVYPIAADGKVGAVSDNKLAGKGPGMSECHQSIFDKAGLNLFVTCKAKMTETISQYKFADGKLTANTPPTVTAAGGVRHLAFSADEKFAYGITERENAVITFSYDKATGKLTLVERVPALINPAAAGFGSHILIHQSGKFLFVGSRLDNAILTFSIDAATGKVTKASHVTTADGVSFPRNFDLDPTGTFLIVGNQSNDGMAIPANKKEGGDVIAFRIDQATGKLTKAGTTVKLEPSVWYVGAFTLP